MNQIVPILFLLFISLNTYADCTTKNASITYEIPTLLVDHLNYSQSLSAPINQQVLGGCTQPSSIFLHSNFIADSSTLSSSSPFGPMASDTIEILNTAETDVIAIRSAKQFLIQNLRITYSLKDNSTGVNTAQILSTNTQYNIIPATTNNPNNTTVNSGKLFSTGSAGYGIRSVGVQFRDATFSLINVVAPTSEILKTLNGAILRLKLGIIRSEYYFMSSPNTVYSFDTAVYIHLPFKFTMPTCSIILPNTLDLGSTTTILLNQSSQNTQAFDLDIRCPLSMVNNDFKLTILDANNLSNSNNNGTLTNSSLSKSKSNGIIQLINNITNSPFQIGNKFKYFTSTSGTHFTQKISAQLLKSAPNTTTGHIEGRATFLLDYD